MIYFHEIRGLSARTGYGGAYQGLFYALMQRYPGRMVGHPWHRTSCKMDIECEVFFGQPYGRFLGDFGQRHCEHKGIFTMYESERIHPEFIFHVEKYFDFIIVPTKWCKKIFEHTFPDHDVYLCPLGVNPDLYPILHRPINRKPFTYLWQGFAINDRKRADLVIKAFDSLVLPDTRLIIKYLPDISKTKIKHILSGDNKVFIGDQFSFPEILSLWQQCDFGVFPSEGEGVGLIPLECMATGMPVAFNANTGSMEYCNPRYNYPLPCEPTGDSYFQDGSVFNVPTYEGVRQTMYYAYHHQEEIHKRGLASASWMRNYHNYLLSAIAFLGIVGKVTGKMSERTDKAVA